MYSRPAIRRLLITCAQERAIVSAHCRLKRTARLVSPRRGADGQLRLEIGS